GRSLLSGPRGHAARLRERRRDLHAASCHATPPDVSASSGGDSFTARDSRRRCVRMVAECQVLGGSCLWLPTGLRSPQVRVVPPKSTEGEDELATVCVAVSNRGRC